jgi:hypothetical protein
MRLDLPSDSVKLIQGGPDLLSSITAPQVEAIYKGERLSFAQTEGKPILLDKSFCLMPRRLNTLGFRTPREFRKAAARFSRRFRFLLTLDNITSPHL